MDRRPKTFVPKVGLPYPVGRLVAGRIVSQMNPTLYRIDLSGRFYTAEMPSATARKSFSPGDPVYVKVVAKSGNKAMLEIVEPEYPDIDSPSEADISKLAKAAGWPDDPASRCLVAALVARRLPLKSELADMLYRHLKSIPGPAPQDAENFLIRHLAPGVPDDL